MDDTGFRAGRIDDVSRGVLLGAICAGALLLLGVFIRVYDAWRPNPPAASTATGTLYVLLGVAGLVLALFFWALARLAGGDD